MNDTEKSGLIADYLKMRQRVGELESLRAECMLEHDLLQKFKALFSQIDDLAYICDPEGSLLYANDVLEKVTGDRGLLFKDHPFHPLFDEENLKIARAAFEKTIAGENAVCELRFMDTGALYEFKNVPLRDEFGKITGVMGIGREMAKDRKEDVGTGTELIEELVLERTKELEAATEEILRAASLLGAALESHKQKYRALLEAVPDAVIVAEAERGTVLEVNEKASSLTGVSAEEIKGARLASLGLPPAAAVSPEGIKRTSVRNRRSGRLIPVEIFSACAKAANKKIITLVLRETEPPERGKITGNLLTALRQSQSAVVLADVNGAIEFVNPFFEKLTGYKAAEAAGENVRAFFTARSEKEFDDFRLTVFEGTPWRGVLRAAGKKGANPLCNVLVTPVKTDGGPVTHLLYFHDVAAGI